MPYVRLTFNRKNQFTYNKMKALAERLPLIVATALFDKADEAIAKKVKVDTFTPEISVNAIPVAIRIEAGHDGYRNGKGLEKMVEEISTALKPIREELFSDLGENDFFVKVSLSPSKFAFVK